ncbi:MAG: hypothetical protein A2268_07455 [Candidatus Raymondbacteria bacterium RifOxyA12_full_50_37]|uniref:Secretion system C-terminal sorting domain-containing protein n=1 Tax=Candidatus Raymondbacteria bacterium RIFOXYD12_FULL_49_13 TaxID=1817890 RepID=A0A1F7F662_UNCRA|nr:MAG: hypothetical protein A2350_09170 [Candidatus Raymondbacteria bacterium RifOxyB12_full_50_8]OGJ89810.1 MAG: hypothetical protein A2268_07455 [Candidatus Raymondbacteria bacterium RifOxyA12_full_50_37]OGJ91218.1 MAG: hypothetical protein A2248_01600 [Candidatus Raymondbacteria bacterium RIFOXYA2_FULL_49_16]OGJ96146.1 MAG: hypothetical protein A2487_01515 [Candidatus Raymondbacteria bacterium RifOxyC12_full_50_8]OGJ97616.1 MAG: hypothetical protein A2453_02365 [Candidatus Raymondbacteria b
MPGNRRSYPNRIFFLIFLSVSLSFGQLYEYINDPLTDGATLAKETQEGSLGADGWKSLTNTAYLMYELPENTKSGKLIFEVKGFEENAGEGNARQNCIALYNLYQATGNYVVKSNTGQAGIMWRYYYTDLDAHGPGDVRFRIEGLNVYAEVQRDTENPGWDQNTWYTIEFGWSQTNAYWKRNGQQFATMSFPNKDQAFRWLYLSNAKWYDMYGRKDLTIRNVHIMTDINATSVFNISTDQKGMVISAQPHPFNSRTAITVGYDVDDWQKDKIKVQVYNLEGMLMQTLLPTAFHSTQYALHLVDWDASSHPSGVYILKVKSGNSIYSKKLVKQR